MRGVVQVVEPQSSHGPENTGEQIDEIDGHPWSVEGVEERANWQRVVQEEKTRKKQKKTRQKPSPIVVPAGIAELCTLTNSFPDLPSFIHCGPLCGPPTGFINQLPGNQWERPCCLPLKACATRSTVVAASKYRKKINLDCFTYPDGFIDKVFHDSDQSWIKAMLIRSGLTKPDLAVFNSRVRSVGNGVELMEAINRWLQRRPTVNLTPAASYVCDFGQGPEGLLVFELSIVIEALRRLAANVPRVPANETTQHVEMQAQLQAPAAPAEIEGAKGVPKVAASEQEGLVVSVVFSARPCLYRAMHCIPSCKVPLTANMVECASCKNRYHYRCVRFKLARGSKPVKGSAKAMQEVREADHGFEYRCTLCSKAESKAESVHCIKSCDRSTG